MKVKSRWSHKDCKRIIEENKDNTAYFDGSISMDTMWRMFRYDLRFGEAETAVILASLIKCGAHFK